jgi:hypothetical protein
LLATIGISVVAETLFENCGELFADGIGGGDIPFAIDGGVC